jgi:hypothetical protein
MRVSARAMIARPSLIAIRVKALGLLERKQKSASAISCSGLELAYRIQRKRLCREG